MYPEICKIGPLAVYSYGLMLVIAFTVSALLASRYAKKKGFDPDVIFNLCFVIFIFGIIGARLFYVFNNFSYYSKNPLEIIMLQKGGLAWFGGLTLGICSGVYYLKLKKLAIYKTADFIVPFLALGQAIGRLGCFLNGCCFGKESIHGIYFPVHQARLIPTQLYSSLFLVIMFIILRRLQERPHKEGQIFFTYLLFYATKRFFIEFWRADSPIFLSGLTLFQLISICVFILAAVKLYLIKTSKA